MKAFGFSVMFLVIGTALTCLVLSSKGGTSTFPGVPMTFFFTCFTSLTATLKCIGTLPRHGDAMVMIVKSRKLKDIRGGSDRIYLEDYRPIDPVPNSKASIRPGPIQHGTPLMPYIPKPAPSPPPGRPTH